MFADPLFNGGARLGWIILETTPTGRIAGLIPSVGDIAVSTYFVVPDAGSQRVASSRAASIVAFRMTRLL